MSELFVKESPQEMALGEAISFIFDFALIGAADPSAAGVTLAYDHTGADVSATVLSGAASLSGAQVTAKKFTPLVATRHTVVQPATIDGNTVFLACVFEVRDLSQT
jgi:hypothetical protein